jgi:hypothetical protein
VRVPQMERRRRAAGTNLGKEGIVHVMVMAVPFDHRPSHFLELLHSPFLLPRPSGLPTQAASIPRGLSPVSTRRRRGPVSTRRRRGRGAARRHRGGALPRSSSWCGRKERNEEER